MNNCSLMISKYCDKFNFYNIYILGLVNQNTIIFIYKLNLINENLKVGFICMKLASDEYLATCKQVQKEKS